MGASSREQIVEVFDALDADADRLERVGRRLRAPQHTLINELHAQAGKEELGGTLREALANRLRIIKADAGQRIADAEDLGERRALTGEALARPHPGQAGLRRHVPPQWATHPRTARRPGGHAGQTGRPRSMQPPRRKPRGRCHTRSGRRPPRSPHHRPTQSRRTTGLTTRPARLRRTGSTQRPAGVDRGHHHAAGPGGRHGQSPDRRRHPNPDGRCDPHGQPRPSLPGHFRSGKTLALYNTKRLASPAQRIVLYAKACNSSALYSKTGLDLRRPDPIRRG